MKHRAMEPIESEVIKAMGSREMTIIDIRRRVSLSPAEASRVMKQMSVNHLVRCDDVDGIRLYRVAA